MRARLDVSPVRRAAAWLRHADRAMPRAAAAPVVAVPDRARAESYRWRRLLDRYLEGWAEVNFRKIFAASAHGYCFDDPLVGKFSQWNLPAYFEQLRARFARAGAAEPRDFAFVIRGPMGESLQRGTMKFCREAPRLGLTGITLITIGERGVIAESVAYDLNLASHLLCD